MRELDRVAREASASDGVAEGLVQGATHVVDRPGVQALVEQDGVEVLDVLGLEPGERCWPIAGTMWSRTSTAYPARVLGRTRSAVEARR